MRVSEEGRMTAIRKRPPRRRRDEVGADFLHLDEIELYLHRWMVRGEWYPLREIYRLIESRATLTHGDWEPDAPGSNSPRWQRNVRNWLQGRKATGDVEWRDRAEYRLP
jgi:hypothetical protein